MYEDDAENARAALRALWGASGQLDGAESLGKEQQFAGVSIPTDVRSEGNDGKGGDSAQGGFGSSRHNEVGLSDFGKTNEATFDRGEAASKLKEAWRSTLIAEGKMGSQSQSLGKTAKETSEKFKTGADGAVQQRPGSVDDA
ncbi:MAG TPA: hypothetical protein VM754_00600 [Actinomycetota bacterium]|nr:hypothetical protein [Actinomycetota bacterium]